MKILAHGQFDCPRNALPGDRFVLWMDGKQVHSREITEVTSLSHWAHFVLPGAGEAYAVGNEKLFDALRALETP